MPKLSQIVALDVAEFKVEKHDLTVKYRPGVLTAASQDTVMDLMEDKRELPAFAKLLSGIIVTWDLTGDDDLPYPTDEAALRELPGHFLADVVNAFFEQQRPNDKKSKTSEGSF